MAIYGICNKGRHAPLVALHHIVISDLTVYTRRPTGRGLTGSFLWVVTRGWRVPLRALPNNFALRIRGSPSVKKAVKSQRPVNLDLRTIKLPITAYTSILHRVSGVVLFVGVAILLLALDASLSSAEGFEEVKAYISSPLAKLVIWVLLSALLYHLVAGVRHLIMDTGHGETLEGGKLGSKIVLAVSAVLIVLAGVWIW